MKHTHGFTNTTLSIIIGILSFAIGAMGYSLWHEKNLSVPTPTPTPMITETITLTPTMTPSPTLTPTSTPSMTATPTVSELIQLQEAFAKKYNRKTADVKVTISKNDGSHISGGISFEGEMSGGWFLSAKTNGTWVIVQDGNGTINCATIAPYNFSSSMVPGCWDEKTQKLIKR